MKCFYLRDGVCKPGVRLYESESLRCLDFGPVLLPPHLRVMIRGDNPPDTVPIHQHTYVKDAFPVYLVGGGDRSLTHKQYILAKPDPKHRDDTRVLLQYTTYTPDCCDLFPGNVTFLHGPRAESLVDYVYETDRAGYAQMWRVGLLRLEPGDVVLIKNAGVRGTDYVVSCLDNEQRPVRVEVAAGYYARRAVEDYFSRRA